MEEALQAAKGERSEQRLGYRSGYYNRTLVTRVGKIELRRIDRGGSARKCLSAISAARKHS